MNASQRNPDGWKCPVRGCLKRRKHLYSLLGLVMHMEACHPGEMEKRLHLRYFYRSVDEKGREVFVQEPYNGIQDAG